MSETKHTPGPWRLNDSAIEELGVLGRPVSVVGWINTEPGDFINGEDEASANAVLMTAAPELLEALQTLAQQHHEAMGHGKYRPTIEGCNKPVCREARAAIIRAKGGAA